MTANGNQADPGVGFSTGWNARRSLNLLKFSLNRPMILPRKDDDGDEEMEIIQEAEQVLSVASEAYNNMDTDVNMKEEISEQIDCLKVDVANHYSEIAGDKEEILINDEDTFGKTNDRTSLFFSSMKESTFPKSAKVLLHMPLEQVWGES